jgi:hypothetical protein
VEALEAEDVAAGRQRGGTEEWSDCKPDLWRIQKMRVREDDEWVGCRTYHSVITGRERAEKQTGHAVDQLRISAHAAPLPGNT